MIVDLLNLILVCYGSAVLYALLHDGDSLPAALMWPVQQLPIWIGLIDPNAANQVTTLTQRVTALEQQLAAAIVGKLTTPPTPTPPAPTPTPTPNPTPAPTPSTAGGN